MDFGIDGLFDIKKKHQSIARLTSHCGTMAESFGIQAQSNQNLRILNEEEEQIDWQTELWKTDYIDVKISSMNLRQPDQQFVLSNDFKYEYIKLTPYLIEIRLHFNPKEDFFLNYDFRMTVEYTLNNTHFYKNEFGGKVSSLERNEELDGLINLAKVPMQYILSHSIYNGWVIGLLSLVGGGPMMNTLYFVMVMNFMFRICLAYPIDFTYDLLDMMKIFVDGRADGFSNKVADRIDPVNFKSQFLKNTVPRGDYISYLYMYATGARLFYFLILKAILLFHYFQEDKLFDAFKYFSEKNEKKIVETKIKVIRFLRKYSQLLVFNTYFLYTPIIMFEVLSSFKYLYIRTSGATIGLGFVFLDVLIAKSDMIMVLYINYQYWFYLKYKYFTYLDINPGEEAHMDDVKEPILYRIFKNEDRTLRLSKYTKYRSVWINYLNTNFYDNSVNLILPKVKIPIENDTNKPTYCMFLEYFVLCNSLTIIIALVTISFQTSLMLISAINNIQLIGFIVMIMTIFKKILFTTKFKILDYIFVLYGQQPWIIFFIMNIFLLMYNFEKGTYDFLAYRKQSTFYSTFIFVIYIYIVVEIFRSAVYSGAQALY